MAKHASVNDAIDAAFEELDANGIVTMQNAGYTMSDAWVDVNTRADSWEKPRGAVFYHGQDRERGIAGQGLLLAFGAYEDDDAIVDAKSIAIAREAVETLARHGVTTEWDGSVTSRIRIPPFEWKKRGDTMAPIEARMSAAEAGDLETVTRTPKKALDERDRYGRTLLTIATENGHTEVVAWLLDAGAKTEAHAIEALFFRYIAAGATLAPKGANHTLLHIAAWHGVASVAMLLLERGFPVEARDPYGATPLISAAMHDKLETIAVLLSAGANVNAHDAIGRSALDHASDILTVRALLSAGANPNGGPQLGPPHAPERGSYSWQVPLQRFEHSPEIVALLLSAGAAPVPAAVPVPAPVPAAVPLPVPVAVPAAAPVAAPGMSVTHPKFGRGQILSIDGDKLTVEFDDPAIGRKKLVSRVLTLLP